MKRIISLFVFLAMATCTGSGGRAPSNLDNACAILDQKPAYLKAFKASEKKWGIPVASQMATVYQESKFRSDARTPFRYALGVIPMGRQSSAFGYSQALDATWKEYKRAVKRNGAKRNKIKDASDFMGWYMHQTYERNGIEKSNAEHHYLAYHEGRTGYARGSFNRKPWLIRVAREVGERAKVYHTQLQACGKI